MMKTPLESTTCPCGKGSLQFSRYCGAYVCDNSECRRHFSDRKGHQELSKCYCGYGLKTGENESTLDADADIDTPGD